ncbi:MAG: hypothetical protein A2252_00860 [Elusimicrobia bacterium RIFOXYA2_FULL_39_19]|nr:MAG: hypothetical protein A2252_00860 [Elusimicrobia bacterium RIFOXYA2_FULL_39_19]
MNKKHLKTFLLFVLLITPAQSVFSQAPVTYNQSIDSEFQDSYDDAVFLYKRGETDAAIYLLQQMEKKYPQDSKVLFKLSEIAIDQKNWSYAIKVLNKASELLPDDVSIRNMLVDLYSIYNIGISEIYTEREIVKIQATNIKAYTRLADLYNKNGMFDEEEWIRRYVQRIRPDNRDNLVKLAQIHAGRQEQQDQIQVYEQIEYFYPNKTKELKKLAYMYGQQQDYFNQQRVLTRVLYREPYNLALLSDYVRVNEINKKKLGLNAFVNAQGYYLTNKSEWYSLDNFISDFSFEYPVLSMDLILKAGAGIDSQVYNPILGNLQGNKNVAMQSGLLSVTKYWRKGKTKISLESESVNVIVSGVLEPKPGVPLSWVTGELWLEDRTFGGSKNNLGFIFSQKIIQELEINAFYKEQMFDNIDALARLINKKTSGFTAIYSLPDQTSFITQYDHSVVYDGNNIKHSLLSVSYPLAVAGQIYDYQHKRIGYISAAPDYYIYLQSQLEYYDYDFKSVYYPGFFGEWRFTLNPYLKYKLKDKYYILTGITYGTGKTLLYKFGFNLGLNYSSKENNLDINLSIAPSVENYQEKTQENVIFNGKSDLNLITAGIVWHF